MQAEIVINISIIYSLDVRLIQSHLEACLKNNFIIMPPRSSQSKVSSAQESEVREWLLRSRNDELRAQLDQERDRADQERDRADQERDRADQLQREVFFT